jgi:nucleoside-diphosphate-sugar epimerase
MPRVLIAGHGYLGRAAAALFEKAGWSVEGWTKTIESVRQTSAADYNVRTVDLTDVKQVRQAAGRFDVVIHSASTRGGGVEDYRNVYLTGVRNLIQGFSSSRILLIGSTSVYAQRNGEWVTEESPAEPEHERGKILRETEQLVLEGHGVVARLSGIYGPGRSYLLQRFLAGEAVINTEADRFVNQIHRDDAASALFFLCSNPSAAAVEVFNVTDDQPILQSDCYRWLAEKLDRANPSIRQAQSAAKRGRSNKRVSNRKLRALGWCPLFPTFAEAMETSVLPSFGL